VVKGKTLRRRVGGFVSVLIVAIASWGFASVPTHSDENPREKELAGITERGRALAEYDAAVWHATDAVQAANPKTVEGQRSIAKKENGKWIVVFGAFNADKSKFLISYEAIQLEKSREFQVTKNEPVKQDEGFYLIAARAIELALTDFGETSRPYDAAVLPAMQAEEGARGLIYVYLYPGQTKVGTYPLGGDVRYLVSADGTRILAKRQMHAAILTDTPAKKKMPAGHHTHAMGDGVEDTDVLHVLQQDPPVAETITTPHFVYEITIDGTIRIRKQKR
jgi:hypothetical protein